MIELVLLILLCYLISFYGGSEYWGFGAISKFSFLANKYMALLSQLEKLILSKSLTFPSRQSAKNHTYCRTRIMGHDIKLLRTLLCCIQFSHTVQGYHQLRRTNNGNRSGSIMLRHKCNFSAFPPLVNRIKLIFFIVNKKKRCHMIVHLHCSTYYKY